MQTLASVLQDFVHQLNTRKKLFLAYSGGLDSSALLHALVEAGVKFTALHVNHQISPRAKEWYMHCEQVAASYGVPFICRKVQVDNTGRGMEDAARQARYRVFQECLGGSDGLITAHHANDQVETFLFRLMRGAGLKGLIGMKKELEFKQFRLYRPWLGVTRTEIHEYAEHNHLRWIEDESNLDESFDRNFIRHRVLPVFSERWPGFAKQVNKTGALLERECALLEEYAAEDLYRCEPRKERRGESLDMRVLSGFGSARQQHVLRYWQAQQGFPQASFEQQQQIENLLHARNDASPEVITSAWEIRRFANRVFLMSPDSIDIDSSRDPLAWRSEEPLRLPDGSILEQTQGVRRCFEVRFRAGGERCHPKGRGRSQTLKKLLQEYSLEPWLRDRVPLIYLQGELYAVGDLFVCGIAEDAGFRWSWTG